MGRPRRTDGPPADERIEDAFFAALREMPFQRITISGIVERAGVNRNSFYYHYADLEDLSRSAVGALFVHEIPQLLAQGLLPTSEEFEELITSRLSPERVGALLAVIGGNSTPELRGILRDAVVDAWLDTFELTRADLDAETSSTTRFVLGGMFELVSSVQVDKYLEELNELRRLPAVQVAAQTMRASFERLRG